MHRREQFTPSDHYLTLYMVLLFVLAAMLGMLSEALR